MPLATRAIIVYPWAWAFPPVCFRVSTAIKVSKTRRENRPNVGLKVEEAMTMRDRQIGAGTGHRHRHRMQRRCLRENNLLTRSVPRRLTDVAPDQVAQEH